MKYFLDENDIWGVVKKQRTIDLRQLMIQETTIPHSNSILLTYIDWWFTKKEEPLEYQKKSWISSLIIEIYSLHVVIIFQ